MAPTTVRGVVGPPGAPTVTWTAGTAILVFAAILGLYAAAYGTAKVAPYADGAGVRRITLERGPCYGWCPAYRLTFTASGDAIYDGQSNVRERGRYEAHFSERLFAPFAAEIAQRGFLTARSRGMMVTDAPATTVTVDVANAPSVATTVNLGFEVDELSSDVYAAALFIDGFAGHVCGWRRVEAPAPASVPGDYSPMTPGPCRDRRGR